MSLMSPSVCEGGIDVELSGTGSATNGRWRPRCRIPMERTLGNRRGERRKTKGMMEMREASQEKCLLCLFSYFRVGVKEKVRGRPASDSEREVSSGGNPWVDFLPL